MTGRTGSVDQVWNSSYGGVMSTDQEKPDSSKALALVDKVMALGIDGAGPLKSSIELAEEYLGDPRYSSMPKRVDSLIKWETTKNFTSGFATGLGGLITLPVSVPAGIGLAWVVQSRMVGAIAHLHGYDVHDDRVRTLVMAALVGDASVKEALKRAGVEISQRGGRAAVKRIPGHVLIAINKKIGFRLLTKAGEKGVVNITKLVPVLGGVVGGGVDAAACRTVAAVARKTFPPPPADASSPDLASTNA